MKSISNDIDFLQFLGLQERQYIEPTNAFIDEIKERFSGGYGNRAFNLEQRFLTQPRVILFHIYQVLVPDSGQFSLEHDFTISQGLLSPPSTLLANSTKCSNITRNILKKLSTSDHTLVSQ